ncbi:hypothetical protein EVG20_g10827 [Dentipellis fragilis]|uniref:Uncharacterized protein n=1 Tax=Dentipellis fragilis TaxID=205917 RepID=A0A4Y9XPY0_9AGAM|nr:hypothetical protein EVG20_g10827 [Dentipellis fragilis]
MIRAALWRKEHPQDMLCNLIPWFLSRGVAFAWRVPYKPPVPPPRLPTYLRPHTRPEWWSSPEGATFARYKTAVESVLWRPHARQWLLRGGLAWRLAVEFGTSDLRMSVLDGPSTSAFYYGRGSTSDIPILSIGDLPSDEENAILTGWTPSGSIWPSLDVWESSLMCTGEWSEPAEFWFDRHLRKISEEGVAEALVVDTAWTRKLRLAIRPVDRRLGENQGSLEFATKTVAASAEAASFALVALDGTLLPPDPAL